MELSQRVGRSVWPNVSITPYDWAVMTVGTLPSARAFDVSAAAIMSCVQRGGDSSAQRRHSCI